MARPLVSDGFKEPITRLIPHLRPRLAQTSATLACYGMKRDKKRKIKPPIRPGTDGNASVSAANPSPITLLLPYTTVTSSNDDTTRGVSLQAAGLTAWINQSRDYGGTIARIAETPRSWTRRRRGEMNGERWHGGAVKRCKYSSKVYYYRATARRYVGTQKCEAFSHTWLPHENALLGISWG